MSDVRHFDSFRTREEANRHKGPNDTVVKFGEHDYRVFDKKRAKIRHEARQRAINEALKGFRD